MNTQELFVQSNAALGTLVEQLRDDQLDLTPAVAVAPNTPDLGHAINALTYDNAWVPSVLEGKTADEVGDRFEPLKTADHVRSEFAKYQATADAAASELTEPDRMVHLSYGDFPAAEYLRHIILYRLLQTYDFAKAADISLQLDDNYLQSLWQEFGPLIEGYRGYGFFPAAIEVPNDADSQTRLFALFGRA
jgi:hypothetical protein